MIVHPQRPLFILDSYARFAIVSFLRCMNTVPWTSHQEALSLQLFHLNVSVNNFESKTLS
jgi:hypothetical protein